jgi:predicted TIM-barrel fold metal-dependent hydrolase
MKTGLLLLIIPMIMIFQNCTSNQPRNAEVENLDEYYSIDDYNKVEKYDVHIHINSIEPYFIEFSKEDNFRLLSINVDVGDAFPPIEEQQERNTNHRNAFPGYLAYATSFKVSGFEERDWQDKTIAYLKESFSKGAIAVKVWKNIGMELKDRDGKFVLIDNPRFDPIMDYIKKNNITLIAHLGEPRNCWLPIEEMTVSGDRNYFSAHPQYHMYLHPEYPSYEELIGASERFLEKHPDLLYVGAHLGSLEWSVDELAKRLDKYPNMAVDMAERISHLQHQAVTDWQRVYDFIIKYQDRLIYGTDIVSDVSTNQEELKKDAHDIRVRHWRFFTSGETMEVPKVTGEFRGMHLPKSVVDKIYRENAKRWFPGLNVEKNLASN